MGGELEWRLPDRASGGVHTVSIGVTRYHLDGAAIYQIISLHFASRGAGVVFRLVSV